MLAWLYNIAENVLLTSNVPASASQVQGQQPQTTLLGFHSTGHHTLSMLDKHIAKGATPLDIKCFEFFLFFVLLFYELL